MPVDVNGLTIETVEDILNAIVAEQRLDVDPNIITDPDEPMGQLNGIFADSERKVWEALAIAYNAFNPDAAEGFLLDAIGALRGTVRLKAKRTSVITTCNLDINTELVAFGDFANVSGFADRRFTPLADFVAPSTGNHTIEFISEELGIVQANATQLSVIATPKTGWNSITNPADADPGRDEELDPPYRDRQEERLAATGSGTIGAIKTAVLGIADVVSVTVFENTTDSTNSDGMPPHSIEVLLFDGDTPAADDDEIAQAIWDNRPGGIPIISTVASPSTGNAIDDDGDTHVVTFSRATQKTVWMNIEITYDGTFDAAAEALVQTTLVTEFEENNAPDVDVIRMQGVCFTLDVANVIDVLLFELGFTSPSAVEQNLVIGSREVATFDTSRITVTAP